MRTDHRPAVTHRRPDRRGGFTLIEIMIAAGIIVLMLAMALPVFRLINGTRSQEGATNLIAALLGRARADAVGLHQPAGVAVVYSPSRKTTYMAEVQFRECQYWSPGVTYTVGMYVKAAYAPAAGVPPIDYFYLCTTGGASGKPSGTGGGGWQQVSGPPLDIAADTDLLPLPAGVGVQTVCNCTFNGGVRSSDGYLSLGVILFDGRGRIAALPYEIDDLLGNADTLLNKTGFGGQYFPSAAVYTPYNQPVNGLNVVGQWGAVSQFGLVVYQRDAFEAQGFGYGDPLYSTATVSTPPADYTAAGANQLAAEQWLDVNATPLLIDRYTGELVRTQ